MEQYANKKYYGPLGAMLVLLVVFVLSGILFFTPSKTPPSPVVTPTATTTAPTDDIATATPVVVESDDLNIKKAPKCVISGCSAQICGETEMMSSCEYREIYQCYKTARCERNTNGQCGWVEDSTLRGCLDSYQ